MDFNFIACNDFKIEDLNDVEIFVNSYPDFQSVILDDEKDLELLLDLFCIQNWTTVELQNSEFIKYWDLSTSKLPEFDEEQFDAFYETWIKKANRDNNMDEFGNLNFLRGLSAKWNKLQYRLIVRER